MHWRLALLAVLVFVPGVYVCMGEPVRAGQPGDDFAKNAVPFLKKHCIHCHGPEKKKAGIEFHVHKDEQAVLKNRKLWTSVLQMVQAGEMPPQERPRPSFDESEKFQATIRAIFARADKNARLDPGRVTMRRLNRAEYDNTIRDLVGVDFNAGEFLPQDDVGYGFDNIGDVLTISPFLMERYLAAADNIMQRAIDVTVSKPAVRHLHCRYLQPFRNPEKTKAPRLLTSKGYYHTQYKLTQEGDFKMRIRCFGQQLGDEPVRISLQMDGKVLKTFDIKNTTPEEFEVAFPLGIGDHDGGVNFLNEFSDKDKKRGLMVDWLELIGPLDTRPLAQRKLFVSKYPAGTSEATADILQRFASKAYRRPATEEEVARLTAFVSSATWRWEKWEAGMQLAMQAVLCSPKFLFRVELDQRSDSAEPHPLDDYQLACRLSYFLWSSMPDDELFALAERKELHRNIEPQVRRMLKDPRAAALVENFGLQWLHLRLLKNANPDPKSFPDWDEPLRKSMLKETELFLRAVMREDRSILDLIDADFTFLDARLARHYGIDDTAGNRVGDKKTTPGGVAFKDEFQRVKLQGNERGGLLTHASILTINSNPTRTSPVKRGRWVLEQILGTPPPPPPPNVPELAEGSKAETKGSLRQRMEQHRANPNCATCHARMDPIGFAFENFNGIGKFRSKDGDFPIDPSGELPGGQKFQGPGDLRRILKGKKQLFGRCLTEKMLTYALGRGVEHYDRNAIDAILASLERNDYRFSTLVVEIARSDPFRLRRGKDQK